MTERCSDCRGDGSNDHPFQVACKQQHPAPFQDEHGFYEKRRLPQRERCPDCHGQWYSRNGPTGAQETCKHPWHDANTPKASGTKHFGALDGVCDDCPPIGYPTNKTRCAECPRLATAQKAEACNEPAAIRDAANVALTCDGACRYDDRGLFHRDPACLTHGKSEGEDRG